jgi:hypothetical protein
MGLPPPVVHATLVDFATIKTGFLDTTGLTPLSGNGLSGG